MCWIGKYIFKKAEKDIPIFKILNFQDGELLSAYRNYPYVLNKEIESEIKITNWITRDVCKVTQALHSYDPEIITVKITKDKCILFDRLWSVVDYYLKSMYVQVKGIIPKDSIYCINDSGECISDKIILNEIVNY